MKEGYPIINGKPARFKDYCVKFLIDYSNKKLRDFWKRKFTYAKYISFDYYMVDEEVFESINDIFYTDFSVLYYLEGISSIPISKAYYVCFIDESSDVDDIDGLLYRIATNEYADVVRYNTLIALKSKNIKKVIA